ncbi:MAG: hypothetical protein A2268_05275 [Candidatus Raymondbacteria bacterium RifOxyA12_full_50_37]|uniref:Secretion system C-terminal sorting domain-containing protein n=1 Tax=Candidatus Raymondbacteria bacterium RIFOXYD12_FULL_49_13 TaxID=1817890 RepID=A0A1F7FBG0_UNCRA|nr:MAG: hypothetical protein A2268_05275 [Candidatus Raymondbacteria bacterium RifOxyA12_full_50_37]OGJ88978.1 MAG: hypothetical protein A2248_02510 [Candidatus Raymondbacteria bacterium RIFOXYA2_FULL_49_16]OGJ97006.1 MAG: hypothetical protein A2453_03930 [Candidatus Raymondbacteria bacterium RIFOXYC2_FULL_50_21]OGK02551.1 MAG: hypothetical protein A2487_14995 [Candidatus Raymondbacteria bacterium RifOxyC12_full_50_8]OGK04004.1 MAG: hypothetical protein A2519_00670 [Candidatus Raymondbacteria b
MRKVFMIIPVMLCIHPVAGLEIIRGPYSQKVTHESCLIVFQSDISSAFSVHYGTSPSNMNAHADAILDQKESWDAWEDNVYVAKLAGLEPATRYYYKVVSGADEYTGIDSMLFTTAPVKGDGNTHFRLFAESDLIYGPSTPWYGSADSIKVAEMHTVHNPVPELWICQGDVEQQQGCIEQYTDGSWWDPFRSMIQKTTICPSVGNHDQECPAGMYYFAAFYLPRNDYDGTEWYYSFDYGNTRFISLHGLPTDTNNVQYRWLVKELADTTPMWKIMFEHYPVYCNNPSYLGLSTRGEKLYDTLCDRYGVDVVISGHIDGNFRSPLMTVESLFTIQARPGNSFHVKTRHGAGTFFVNAESFHWHEKLHIEINGNVMIGTNWKKNVSNNFIVSDQWTITKTINGNDPPVAHIQSPIDQSHTITGSSIVLHGTGADHEDGVLSPARLSWSYKVDHFDGTPVVALTQVAGIADSGNFVPDIEGYYTFYLTASDNNGNSNVDTRRVYVTCPLDTVAKINFGNYSQWGWSHDITQPAGWVNVISSGWTGSFTALDGAYWPVLRDRDEDFLAMRCIQTSSTATWNYPIINGSYYVSLRANNSCALYTDSSNVIKNIRVEGVSALHDTVFYFPNRFYPAGSSRLRETGRPVSAGLPACARYIPVTVTDGYLTVELDTAAICDLMIFNVDSSALQAGNPAKAAFSQAMLEIRPNPFNPAVTIRVAGLAGKAQVLVYDITGKTIFSQNISAQTLASGMEWNAGNRPSGIYVARVRSGSLILTKKMVLQK